MNFKEHASSCHVFGRTWNDRTENWMKAWEALNPFGPRTLLNIGVGGGEEAKHWMDFVAPVFDIGYIEHLEFDEKFVLKNKQSSDPRVCNVQLGDIRKICEIYNDDSFDIIFWSHGPEHILREEWPDTFEQLKRVCSKGIIIQCPWGKGYDYDPEHISKSVQADEFKQFGFTCTHNGAFNSRFGELMAYYVKEIDEV